LDPHAAIEPSLRRAAECVCNPAPFPVAISTTVTPAGRGGTLHCPYVFEPQAMTEPLLRRASVWPVGV
jgi:hypothetical protein